MAKKLEWYGVRSLYITTALGRPKVKDPAYRPKAVLFEERVVLFHAKDFSSAVGMAEKEARVFAKGTITNVYGQKVRTKYLECCDAFAINENPGSAVEVYSLTEVYPAEDKVKAYIDAKLGKKTGMKDDKIRRKFMNREFNRSLAIDPDRKK
ncbi:MAG: DUF4288 domain-containing protein [Bdellovibrionales bacterium]